MTELYDIVEFYKKYEDVDLYTESVFTDKEYHQIDNEIDKKNNEFFSLVKQYSLKKDFGFKILEIIINELSDIHEGVTFRLSSYYIPRFENTPLYKHKIEFKEAFLTMVISQIDITSGISGIYGFLYDHFSENIVFPNKLMTYSYVPCYFDEDGYFRHIYWKLTSSDFLEIDLRNKKEVWVKKIDEFLQVVPSEIVFSLPITDSKALVEENEKCDEIIDEQLGDFLNELNSESEFNSEVLQFFPFDIPEDGDVELNLDKKEEVVCKNTTVDRNRSEKFTISLDFPEENINHVVEKLRNLTKYLINSGDLFKGTELNVLDQILVDGGSDPIRWKGRLNVLNYIFRYFTSYKIDKYSGGKYECISKCFKDSKGRMIKPTSIKSSTSFYGEEILDSLLQEILESCQKS